MVTIGFWLLVLLVLALAIAEWGLRRVYGLGRPPLYVADVRAGYRLAPNQSIQRFGNRIQVNQYSMRSGPVSLARPEKCLRILLLGDSVANGGWWTDQAQIVSAQMEDVLRSSLPVSFDRVEVLNASANSWGPRNELGYVMRFGIFAAQVVVVLLNTDDLFAIAPTSLPVGRHRAYPERRPPLALIELVWRLQPPRLLPEYEALLKEPGDRVGGNLEALRQLGRYVHGQESQLLVAMTPLQRELGSPGPRDYEVKARQRLARTLAAADIVYVDLLPAFNQHPHPDRLYRDHIHLSPEGYRVISPLLGDQAVALLGKMPSPPRSQSQDVSLSDPWSV